MKTLLVYGHPGMKICILMARIQKKGRWEMDRERKRGRGREGEAVRVGFHKFLEGITAMIKPSSGSSRS